MPHKLATEFRGSSVLRVSDEVDATDNEGCRAVVAWLEASRDENATKLDGLNRVYVTAAVALGCEVLLWTPALTT